MSRANRTDGPSRLRYGLRDLFWVVTAGAFGSSCAVLTSWDVGVLVSTMMIVFWQVRHRRYAAVPGAAVGVLIVWVMLPVGLTSSQLLSLTAIGATVGASLNALMCRYYFAGLFGVIVLTILAAVMAMLGLL